MRKKKGLGRSVRRHASHTRSGLTLIELVIALTILSITMIWFFMGILGAASANRMLAMEITANAAIRQQTEEVFAIAMDNADRYENGAQAILYYYGSGRFATLGSTDDEHSLPIGANGARLPKVELDSGGKRLLCRFILPEPGQQTRYTVTNGVATLGDLRPDRNAVGEMVIYLDEADVPAAAGSGGMWSDLGENTNSRASGFDMDRNGKIEARSSAVSAGDFSKPDTLGILQVPIDVNVVYYDTPAHKVEVFSTSRRIVITGNVLDKDT